MIRLISQSTHDFVNTNFRIPLQIDQIDQSESKAACFLRLSILQNSFKADRKADWEADSFDNSIN